MEFALRGKRALVTGGSRGIGAAIVQRLAREGADVAFTWVSHADQADKVAAEAKALGVRTLPLKADNADSQAIVGAVERAVQEFGGIDILVNSAGIGTFAAVDELSLKDFDRTFAINVRAVFVATQAAVKHMKEGGRIINIGSCNAERMPFAGGAGLRDEQGGARRYGERFGPRSRSARHHDQQHSARPSRYGPESGHRPVC